MNTASQDPKPDGPKLQSHRERIYEIIFGAHTPAGLAFDILLLIAIICSIAVTSLESVGWINAGWSEQLSFLKWFFTYLFTAEYLLRLYCVRRPLKYAFSVWGIIDLLAILPDYLLYFFTAGISGGAFSVIRSLRLLRVFRILNLSWFQHEGEDLGNAIWNARGKIVVFLMVVMIIVTVSGTIMYEVERATADKVMVVDEQGKVVVNEQGVELVETDKYGNEISTSKFQSIPDGIYWAIVTMTTVGFGDIVPITFGGKIISAILILVGYSLIIVPTGFVSAEVIDAKKRKRREKKVTTIGCSSCITEGHDEDAVYCKFCGERL